MASSWISFYAVAVTACKLLCLVGTIISVASATDNETLVNLQTSGLDIQHLFSDEVKSILDLDGLPEEGTASYYSVMTSRDVAIRKRNLAASSFLTFSGQTNNVGIDSFSFLLYANISVGTPPVSFLVGLTTQSDFSWLPCDCQDCIRDRKTPSGKDIKLNMYSPNASTSSNYLSCSDSFCFQNQYCVSPTETCRFMVNYPSGTIVGKMVKDYLHLVTDDGQMKTAVKIPFGCATNVIGVFLESAYFNGLLGLGRTPIAMPNILASQGKVSDSFSICFGRRGSGKVLFGDQGTLDQSVTPFNLIQGFPYYTLSVAHVSVSGIRVDVSFTIYIDISTEFTYLKDPEYSLITNEYNTLVKKKRIIDPTSTYEFCYEITGRTEDLQVPNLEFAMKGGSVFNVKAPVVFVQNNNKIEAFCLAIGRTDSDNGMGIKFLEGYSVVFNREKDVLGWKAMTCGK